MIGILPVLDAARTFMHQSKLFCEEHNFSGEKVVLPVCVDLVTAMVCAAIAERMKWIDHERIRNEHHSLGLNEDTGKMSKDEDDGVVIDPRILCPEAEIARSITRLFPWYVELDSPDNDDDTDRPDVVVSDLLNCGLVDETWLFIQDAVGRLMPEETWDIWYLKNIGRDVYLQQGMDYRAWDWERMVKANEDRNG